MRPQYHLRNSERGLLAWDVRKLIARTLTLHPQEIPLSGIREIDERFWYDSEGDSPTCRSVAEHAKLIDAADLSYPIIIDSEGRVVDGMHRVCKALNWGLETIAAYQLTELPEPDFVGVSPQDLPYETNQAEQGGAGNPAEPGA